MTQAPYPRRRSSQQDVEDLHELGYAQELLRSMGGFSNFAISFSIISILTGAVILYDYGLAWAGTAAVLIGWPLVTVFVLLIAASMGEIASAYPTAGGLYYWASRMKNKNWGWWTAWLNLIGQFAIVAGINYAAAGVPQRDDHHADPGQLRHRLRQHDEFILGQTYLNGQLVTMGILMLVELALNIAGINLVAILNQVSVWWHIAIVAAVVVLIFARRQAGRVRADAVRDPAAGRRPAAGTTTSASSTSTTARRSATRSILAFFFSLLQANWTYTGYDASAHVAEETVGARDVERVGRLPVGRRLGDRRLHLPVRADDPPAEHVDAVPADARRCRPRRPRASTTSAAASPSSTSSSTTSALARLGGILAGRASRSRWRSAACRRSRPPAGCCSRSAATTGSPARGWLKKVSHRFRTPANSLTAIVVVAWLFSVAGVRRRRPATAIVIVTAISTIFLYAAYGVVHLPGRDHVRVAQGARLEPRSPVQADRLAGDLLGHRPDDPVLVADVGQHLVPVHGRRP